jgi:hypothetical protein
MRLKLIALTVTMVAMTLVPAISHALPACGSWSIVSSPNVDPTLNDNELNDVTAISSSNVWAVGRYSNAESPGPESTLVEHWNGTSWNVVPTPNATDSVDGVSENRGNRLNAVTAISGSNIWAVGAHGTFTDDPVSSETLVEHWNGTAWKIVESPNPDTSGNELNAIVALSASNIWAVGSYVDSSTGAERPLGIHWNGTAWQGFWMPSHGTSSRLFGIAKIPGTSKLWAVGDYEKVDPVTGARHGGALIEKFSGKDWTGAAFTSGWEKLKSVTAISSSSAFAVGSSVMRWNGTSWKLVPDAVPANGGYAVELESVTRAPNGNLWAAGWRNVPETLSYSTLIERWDGATWSVVPSADRGRSFLEGIARVPKSTRVWSVGYSSDLSPHRTLVETYC